MHINGRDGIQCRIMNSNRGHCWQIISRYCHFIRKEFLLRVAFIRFQSDRNFECFVIAFARIQGRQKLFDQERLDGIRFQIVVGFDACSGKPSESQRRFGILNCLKILEWRVAVEAFFERKFPLPSVPRADNFYAIEIIEKHQATNSLVEFVPGLQQSLEAIKIFVGKAITVVRNGYRQRVWLIERLNVDADRHFGRAGIQRIGQRFEVDQGQRRVGEKQPDGAGGFNVHFLRPAWPPPVRAAV